MGYIKGFIWGVMFILCLFILADAKEGGWTTITVLGIGYVVATLFRIYIDRKKGCTRSCLPTDSNHAVVLVVLALDNVLGGDTPEYMFIVSVVVLWLLFDTYNRSETKNRLDG
ncbi:MAG: hypothetical protein K2N13_10035 [Paraprevotella sp.]|nr:hypothetical protein [Paraprevotella sp.]